MKSRQFNHSITVLLLLSLFCSFIFAKYTSAEMEVNIDWNIIADGYISYSNLSVSIPSNSSNQKVTSIQISEPYTLEMNGSVWRANIELYNFSEKTVKGKFIVTTDYIKRTQIWDTSTSDYLNPSKLVDINEDIRAEASKFSGISFPNNTISLAKWVHENLEYDKAYISGSYPASSVLETKRGVCDEYSHLFIAMCRSLGIPARIVVGYVFDSSGQIYGNDSWTPHAWAEVYDKGWGWIEVDPTYEEFLNLDALRVRTATGIDQEETKDKLEALGVAKELNFSASTSIKILRKSEVSKINVNLELIAQPEDSLSQPVTIIIKNSNQYPIFLTASLAVPQGIDCNCSNNVLLQPGEKKKVSYDLNLSGVIEPDMKYNFSVKALTEYGSAEGSFERMIITPAFTSVQELPPQFMLFIAIAVGVAIILIIVAIVIRW